ncbi:MAG: hypothetical protein V9E86_07870 [Nitrosomonas sp.]
MRYLWAVMLVTVLFVAACGGANNATSSSSSGGGSSDSDKPSGPDLTTPAGTAKAVAEAFGSGDFAKFDPLWAKSVTPGKEGQVEERLR